LEGAPPNLVRVYASAALRVKTSEKPEGEELISKRFKNLIETIEIRQIRRKCWKVIE
jgi:hypothetical protein